MAGGCNNWTVAINQYAPANRMFGSPSTPREPSPTPLYPHVSMAQIGSALVSAVSRAGPSFLVHEPRGYAGLVVGDERFGANDGL